MPERDAAGTALEPGAVPHPTLSAPALLTPALFVQAGAPGMPGFPALGEDEVHLWRLSLDQPPRDAALLAAALDAAERERAARFHFARDRDRFATGRGLLRWLLGAYAGSPEAALRFGYGPHGKPHLAQPPLAFNLAHSGGWALLAVARHGALGADLEAVRDIPDHMALARGNFAPGEVAALLRLPAPRRRDGFFACWACKEAYVKLRGTGLAERLDGFEVSVDPDAPAALLSVGGAAPAAGSVRFWGGEALPGLRAAVAASGPATQLRPLRLDEAPAC